jgi:Resolvase, N terminal domain
MSSMKRAALYVRVSTDAQTVENQIRELRQVAKRRGWDVVEVYSDAGISGAKGRNGWPAGQPGSDQARFPAGTGPQGRRHGRSPPELGAGERQASDSDT